MPNTQKPLNHRIIDTTVAHFSPGEFEYGRPDMAGQRVGHNNRVDGRRDEHDQDLDGRKGVDCSALVWRGLKEAGTDIEKKFPEQTDFTTRSLFNGSSVPAGLDHAPHANLTPFARQNFDYIQKLDELKPGDIMMFKMGGGQHVAIYKGTNERGEHLFFGSQTSTGPAEVNLSTNPYWKQQPFLGALRANEAFFKPEIRQQVLETTTPATPALSPDKQAFIEQARSAVNALHDRQPLPFDSQQRDNIAVALAHAGWTKGMNAVEHALLNTADNSKISLLNKVGPYDYQYATLDAQTAAKQPAEHSLTLLADTPERQQIQHNQEQQHQLDRSMPQPGISMGRT